MNINYKLLAVIFAICQLFQSIVSVSTAPTINQDEIFIDTIMVASQAIRIYPKSFNSTRMEHYHTEHNTIEW